MKKNITITLGIFICTVLLVFFGTKNSENKDKTPIPVEHADVVLTEKSFVPNVVYIKLNGTVTFSTDRDKPFWPASDPHPTHGIYKGFDPHKSILPGEKWSFKFDRAGEWHYHDHLRSYFIGTVYVVE